MGTLADIGRSNLPQNIMRFNRIRQGDRQEGLNQRRMAILEQAHVSNMMNAQVERNQSAVELQNLEDARTPFHVDEVMDSLNLKPYMTETKAGIQNQAYKSGIVNPNGTIFKGILTAYLGKQTPQDQRLIAGNAEADLARTLQEIQAIEGSENPAKGLKAFNEKYKGMRITLETLPQLKAAINQDRRINQRSIDVYEEKIVAEKDKEARLAKFAKDRLAFDREKEERQAEQGERRLDIQEQAAGNVESITFGAEGTTIFKGPGAEMTRTTETRAQKKIADALAGLGRLERIGQTFKPEFLELETKWDTLVTKWKDKLGMKVSKAERKQLEDFSAFRRDSLDNINRYIHELTGAQMSAQEAKRLRQAAPDPGEGLLDGNSPIEFESRWKSSIEALRLVVARTEYLMRQGLTPQAIKKLAESEALPGGNSFESLAAFMADKMEEDTIDWSEFHKNP